MIFWGGLRKAFDIAFLLKKVENSVRNGTCYLFFCRGKEKFLSNIHLVAKGWKILQVFCAIDSIPYKNLKG